MAIHLTPEANPTIQEGTLYVDSATGEFNVAGRTVPHIIPGVLYPAVSGNDLSGTALGGSYIYGTAHTDGRKYYYTDIKGSKPIKDPRIGGHFGSQRHTFTSLQLLEQETATHSDDVFSLDGREWLRAVGSAWYIAYDSTGTYLRINNSSTEFVEITGYFNDVNMFFHTSTDSPDAIDVFVDGTENATTNISDFKTSVNTPLGQRYVNAGSLHNIGLQSTSLGIHTIKLIMLDTGHTAYCRFSGIELIAQDTTSTANRSKIQIPSQNVVSYGKKFTVSETSHYDPFSAKTDGSAWTSPTSGSNTANSSASWPTNIDTAHSLGLENWVNGSNYYRPYNGGRVVKYVDSTGTIKTAVTVMPPNARSIANGTGTGYSGTEKGDDSAGNSSAAVANTTFLPTFTDQTIATAQELSELAKRFHPREFGNGGANGNTSFIDLTNTPYSDATEEDTAFVMDDGLTSYNGTPYFGGNGQLNWDANNYWYWTFIGSGFSYSENDNLIAMNLPYGSHIVKHQMNGGSPWYSTITVDGVQLGTQLGAEVMTIRSVNFHQPKKPPIPEDACVIADYMLLADFVPQTSAGSTYISKGTRRQNVSRDVFVNHLDGTTLELNHTAGGNPTAFGYYLNQSGTASSETRFKVRIPSFGTNYVLRSFQAEARSRLFIDDTDKDSAATKNNDAVYDSFAHLTSSLDLGSYNFGANSESGSNLLMSGFDVATPIHTSSHYQSFETPYLHELVGGDRNMEQTNLVVSPDGKTWDQITRDTSYIGNHVLNTIADNASTSNTTVNVFDNWRGQTNSAGTDTVKPNWIKDSFAIAYNKIVCLKEGSYQIMVKTYEAIGHASQIYLNDTLVSEHYTEASSAPNVFHTYLKRGDTIQIKGQLYVGLNYNQFSIVKI